MTEKIQHLTKTDLLNRSNWTAKAIELFLPTPDDIKKNPYSANSPPMKLYNLQRIYEIEKSLQFLEWKEKTARRRQGAARDAAKRKENTKARSHHVAQCWTQLKPLHQLTMTNWAKLDWQHFSEHVETTEEEKKIIIKTANKMLGKAYWIPVDLFFEVFFQWGRDNPETERHANLIAESIAEKGWQGIPFVSFFTEDGMGRVQLDSGHHRWIALKELREQGEIDAQFKVPVFDLGLMPKFIHLKYRSGAEDAILLAKEGMRESALSIYTDNWVLSVCTGIDC